MKIDCIHCRCYFKTDFFGYGSNSANMRGCSSS